METKNSEKDTNFSEKCENNSIKYNCDVCDYICSKKQHRIQHLKTKRHIFNNETLVSKNGNNWKPEGEFDCECGSKYTYSCKSAHLKALKYLKYCETRSNI